MKLKILALVTAGMFSTTTLAAAPVFDYVEAGYMLSDVDGFDSDFDGFSVAGSALVNKQIFVTADFSNVAFVDNIGIADIDVDVRNFNVGVGYRMELMGSTDGYVILGYGHEKVEEIATFDGDTIGKFTFSEKSPSASIGIRSMVTNEIEIDGKVKSVFFDSGSETAVKLGINYYLDNNISLGTSYEIFDNVDTFALSLRYTF
jgi:long-subunit fatty acid transport protein